MPIVKILYYLIFLYNSFRFNINLLKTNYFLIIFIRYGLFLTLNKISQIQINYNNNKEI
jgi:hypothetical protein